MCLATSALSLKYSWCVCMCVCVCVCVRERERGWVGLMAFHDPMSRVYNSHVNSSLALNIAVGI